MILSSRKGGQDGLFWFVDDGGWSGAVSVWNASAQWGTGKAVRRTVRAGAGKSDE